MKMEKVKFRQSIARTRTRWLRLCFALLLALGGFSPAQADNSFYKDKTEVVTWNDGNGTFKIRYLTYDFNGLDDYIDKMSVYLVANGREDLILYHRGAHSDGDQDLYNDAYGDVLVYTGYSYTESTYAEGNCRYREYTFKVTQYLWGTAAVRVVGNFRYCKDGTGSSRLDFDYTGSNFSLGDCKLDNPTITSVAYKPSAWKATVSLGSLPYSIHNDATKLYVKFTGGDEVEKVVNSKSQDFEIDLPKYYDITSSSNSVSVRAALTVGTLTANTSTVSKTIAPFAKATIKDINYDTGKRAVSLSWSAENASSADYVSIFRRIGSGTWTTVGNKLSNTTVLFTDNASDNSLEPNKTYEYKIVYGSSQWPDATGDADWKGTASTTVTTTNVMPIELTASRLTGGVKLDWTIPSNDAFNNCDVEIYRAEGSGQFAKIATQKYSTSGTYTDSGISGSFKYYVLLKSNGTWYKEDFSSEKVTGLTIDATYVSAMRASKGDFSGRVLLEMDVKNYASPTTGNYYRTTYTVSRKSMEDANGSYVKLSTFSSTDDYVQYDDNSALPGIYYDYKVDYTTTANDDVTQVDGSISEIGFTLSSGKVMGSITYGTGTAVEGVDVVAVRTSTGNDMSSSRALEFNATGKVNVNVTSDYYGSVFGNDFTIQLWMKPTAISGNTKYYPIRNHNNHKLILSANGTGTCQMAYEAGNKTYTVLTGIPCGEYSHVTIIRKNNTVRAILYKQSGDEIVKVANDVNVSTAAQYTDWLEIGNSFKGLIDECRIWNKALTDDEVADNYNRSLVGNESDLAMYYRFDEGLRSQIFDCSRKGTVQNGHHGYLDDGVYSSIDVPTQLGYRGKTDSDGNYIIEGIPFGGEGTSYSIVPQMGIHEFSPIKQMRYIGPSSLVHNSTDFKDVSSFPVSGVVYYENTLYPVEGCYLYVDGTICSNNGEIIMTDENGCFTVDVPIGDHYIEVRKQDHTFVAAGRYPEDPNAVGTTHTFNQRIDGLTFYDNTLVNLSGRIVGGSIEAEKPLGFGLSTNNIGQVELILQPVDDRYSLNVVRKTNEGSVSYDNNTSTLECFSATNDIKSTSWRGAGNDSKKIYVRNDKNTGEFSLQLPPLRYKVISANIIKNGMTVIDSENGVSEIDMTNVAQTESEWEDSEGESNEYVYNKAFNITYHTSPTLDVIDEATQGNAFGIKEFEINDKFGTTTVSDIYTVNDKGEPTYRYGAPVFIMNEPYIFKISGYEEYVNVDNGSKSRVPLAGVEVNIENALSAEQPVFYEGANAGEVSESQISDIILNDRGEAYYKWLGGLPNISESGQADVPDFARTISISYIIDGKVHRWANDGMFGILLGELTTGTNFVTSGPDKVEMVLRDPPGTASHAEWQTGSVTVINKVVGGVWNLDENIKTTTFLGATLTQSAGIGVAVITSLEAKNNLVVGLDITDEGENSTTTTSTYTATRAISTSDAPEYVGSQGDVYIGRATNLTFGKARQIGFTRESADAEVEITKQDVMTTGISFGTVFNYTQNFIENVLIPNFEALLEQNLITMSESEIQNYTNNTDSPVYLTPYSPGDDNYGRLNYEGDELKEAIKNGTPISNGPNYYMVLPKGMAQDECTADSVMWIINQIDAWEKAMANNEADKVRAFYEENDKCLIHNISFDSGTKVSYTEQTDTVVGHEVENTFMTNVVVGGSWGMKANDTGVLWEVEGTNGGGVHTVEGDENTQTAVFAYEFAEEGDDDALSVDVLKSTVGWSPIFHTRAGQTCGPYEGEEVTKYYNPGRYVLNEATMQIEVPKITVDVPVLSDVPTGTPANYTLRLTNESEIDEDVYYKLLIVDETNPNGAAFTIDGVPLAEGRRIKVPAGQTVTKLLQLKQSDVSVLDYENIAIVLGSETQFDPTSTWDVIADTCYVTAHFVPSSSDVTMHIDAPTVNTSTGAALNLNFDNFDRNYTGLKAFRVQYRAKGDNNWNNIAEYVLDENDKTANNLMLPDGAKVALLVDMNDYVDGEYTFRILSVATYGSEEVTRPSNEIIVIKDMARPQLISIASPTDGILNAGDEISVVFNEDIRQGYITDAANFLVRGRLNGAKVSHDGVFQSQGGNGAQTQASVDLAGRDFAIGHWVKWSKGGSLVHHGTVNNNLDIAITEEGNLKVSIAGNEYVSENAIPQDKWCYLNVAYDNNNGDPVLTADVASDASSINLFNRVKVCQYEGNGSLTIGQGITAAIHEVTLWNYARGFYPNEANVTRSASTDGLIGYWTLDEGHGTIGEDKARSRHLTMPEGNNWSMESENYALQLDGSSYASLDMTKTGSEDDQNYTLELWFRGDKQEADATIFSTVAEGLELMVTEAGLTLNAAGESNVLSENDYMDNTWHHFALNVLKGTGGMASAFVDGNLISQINAANLPALQTDVITLGAHRTHIELSNYDYSQFFKGAIDEVRFWNGTQTAASIRSNIYNKVETDAPALAAYYPFEEVGVDEFNQVVTSPSLSDKSATAAKDATVTHPTEWSTKESPALKDAPALENVPFSFVASERKIIINLEADQQRIEGCNLQFTVRGIQDMNGNYSNDINWSAYVKQNQLEWSTNEISVKKEGGVEATFNVDIINDGGETIDWSLSGLPMWLSTSNEAGSLLPQSQKTLSFTVDAGTAIGRYEAIIGLSGTNGVTSNLIVNLVVTGQRPDWTVDPSDYEHSMNVVAQLKVDGQLSEDPEDIVAVFIDGECRGVAQPVYYQRYDAYYLMMTIYGNADDETSNRAMLFKAFDASTGDIYPEILVSEKFGFAVDVIKGSASNPIILSTTNNREQDQQLAKGWNWISLFVQPEENSVSNVLASIGENGITAKSKTAHVSYDDGWTAGDLRTIDCGKMYKVQLSDAANLNLIGELINPAENPITIAKGWNWIGYNSSSYMPIDEAFADLQPADGDVVKSRGQFAMFMGYEWVGSLISLQPGQGYVYMSEADGTKTFRYPTVKRSFIAPAKTRSESQCKYEACDEHKYQGNMTMVAQAWYNNEPLECEIAVFDQNGECRASNLSSAENNLVFLTIQGEGTGELLTFRVVSKIDEVEHDMLANETYVYVNDAMAGSIAEPFILDLKGNTSLIHKVDVDDEVDYYNLNGIRVHDSYKGYKVTKGHKVIDLE